MRLGSITVAVALLVSLAETSPAYAWRQATGCAEGCNNPEVEDIDIPLYRRFRTLVFRPSYDTFLGLQRPDVEWAMQRAAASWNEGVGGCSDIRVVIGPEARGIVTNLVDTEPPDDEARIVFRDLWWPPPDDWEPATPNEPPPRDRTLALTSTRYNRRSGWIVSVDIDFNGRDHRWYVDRGESQTGAYDLENTLVHEMGHAIGLGHSEFSDATMAEHSSPGELNKRTLSEDDIEGVCTIYPDGQESPGAPQVVDGRLTTSCGFDTTPSSLPPVGWLALPLVLFGRRLWRRLSTEGERSQRA